MLKNIVISALAVATLVFGGLYIATDRNYGAVPGQDHTNPEIFYDTATLRKPVLGYGLLTPTAGATTTSITAAQVCSGNTVRWNSGASATATLPTAQALVASCIPFAGNSVTVLFTSSAATTTYNLAAATGTSIFGNFEVSTTTSNMTISSSTPVAVRFTTTLASSTDSTVMAVGIKSVAL